MLRFRERQSNNLLRYQLPDSGIKQVSLKPILLSLPASEKTHVALSSYCLLNLTLKDSLELSTFQVGDCLAERVRFELTGGLRPL